ncbi:MAG: helix-turn-helix domain-containing protein [Gammaproteobacteria bacterium]|nr:helix-turn-helix domain-containing protein [Gammaproteobacteria bacterium]
MQVDPFIKNPPFNKCKHCRVASACLPANLNKTLIKDAKLFNFRARILEPGQHLCHQGQVNDHIYAIRSGTLKSYLSRPDGEEFVMEFHLPPELFGWEALDPEQGALSVIALDHCNVCEIPIAKLEKLMGISPELVQQLTLMFSHKIRSQNMILLRTSAEQRVAHFILQLSIRYQALGNPYNLCKLDMTHQDIANYLRIAPETISRTLRNMQTRGIIKSERRKIYIENMPKLRELSQLVTELSVPELKPV